MSGPHFSGWLHTALDVALIAYVLAVIGYAWAVLSSVRKTK